MNEYNQTIYKYLIICYLHCVVIIITKLIVVEQTI